MTINAITSVVTRKEDQKSILTRNKGIGINPESLEKPIRRRFVIDCELRIMSLADACTEPGSAGALLRREGLYSSHLS